jgi:RNA polymerase sigma factor (sigma-70 family)
MSTSIGKMVEHLRQLVGPDAAVGQRDAELLARFAGTREEAAFATLVARHGPLVYGLCRRVLHNAHDAEDAFQATFLVLARQASAIRKPASLASWLYGVASRLAMKMKSDAGKRRQREQAAAPPAACEPGDLSWREFQGALDEELRRLPETQRQALLLCYLEGLSQEEAATQLGWPRGTLKRRLERGREVLRQRLTRRGLTMAAGLLAVLPAGSMGAGAVPAGVGATLPVAASLFAVRQSLSPHLVGDRAVALAEGALKTMLTAKVKFLSLLVVLLGATLGGAVLYRQSQEPESPLAEPLPPGQGLPADAQPGGRTDRHDDPLPPDAVTRLGTLRWRHAPHIAVLAFTAQGKELVTIGLDGTARTWDVTSGREVRRAGKATSVGHGTPFMHPAAESANGARVAITGNDGCVRVFDLATGKEVRNFKSEGKDDLVAVALTPDGTGMLISSLGGRIVLWDVGTGKERRRFEFKAQPSNPTGGAFAPVGVGGIVFSRDGKFVAAPFLEGAECGVLLWDAATGKEVRRAGERLPGSGQFPSHMVPPAFSPDGKLITRVAQDGTIHLHNTSTGKEVLSAREAGKGSPVIGISFAPDGNRFAALLSDHTVRLHETATGKVLRTCGDGSGDQADDPNRTLLLGNAVYFSSSDVPPPSFSPDGKTLAVAVAGNTVRLWDTATGKPLPLPAGHHGAVVEVIPSADSTTITTRGADGTLRRWELATGKEAGRVTLQIPDETKAAFLSGRLFGFPATEKQINPKGVLSPSGRLLAYPVTEKQISVWEVTTGKLVVTLEIPDEKRPGLGGNQVHLWRFSPDESVLATGEFGGTVRLWSLKTGKSLTAWRPATGDEGPDNAFLYGLDLASDGTTLLTVRLFDANAPNPVASVLNPPPYVPKCVLCLWDTASGLPLRRWETRGTVWATAFSPDGRALATATEDRVTVWEVATGKERFHCKDGAGLLEWSPDGRVLAAGSGSVIRLIDRATGQEFGQLMGHEGEVQALAFLPAGKGLVSGSADSTALVWGGPRVMPPAAKIDEIGAERLDALWEDLASQDAVRAFRAAGVLRSSPGGAVTLLGKHLKPVAEPDAKQIERWLLALDSDDFTTREKASSELGRLGDLARPALESAFRKGASEEAARRIRTLLDQLKPTRRLSLNDLRAVRAVEVLQSIATPEAKRLLSELAGGAPGAWLTRAARGAGGESK